MDVKMFELKKYESPEVEISEIAMSSDGFCVSPESIEGESNEHYGSEIYNWE